ncbi:MAG: hypothetical protein ACR2OR_06665 [Hyphomicrobiales bacterium]
MSKTITKEATELNEGGQEVALNQLTDEEFQQYLETKQALRQKTAEEQFEKLKDEAQAVFGQVKGGYNGVKSTKEWDAILEEARDSISNGSFLVRCLGAERFLDFRTVAVLITYRQNLIAELDNATAANMMLIDAAVMSFHNMLRAQGWLGNLCLEFEGELFARRLPDNPIRYEKIQDLEQGMKRMNDVILPHIDRAQKMLIRALTNLKYQCALMSPARGPWNHQLWPSLLGRKR